MEKRERERERVSEQTSEREREGGRERERWRETDRQRERERRGRGRGGERKTGRERERERERKRERERERERETQREERNGRWKPLACNLVRYSVQLRWKKLKIEYFYRCSLTCWSGKRSPGRFHESTCKAKDGGRSTRPAGSSNIVYTHVGEKGAITEHICSFQLFVSSPVPHACVHERTQRKWQSKMGNGWRKKFLFFVCIVIVTDIYRQDANTPLPNDSESFSTSRGDVSSVLLKSTFGQNQRNCFRLADKVKRNHCFKPDKIFRWANPIIAILSLSSSSFIIFFVFLPLIIEAKENKQKIYNWVRLTTGGAGLFPLSFPFGVGTEKSYNRNNSRSGIINHPFLLFWIFVFVWTAM